MQRLQKAYLLKDRNFVVTKKSLVANASDQEFEEVSLVIPLSEIKQWIEEIELMDLDEDED